MIFCKWSLLNCCYILLLFNGCKASQNIPLEQAVTPGAQILTIIIKISPSDDGTLPVVEIYEKIRAEGFLKNGRTNYPKKREEGSIIAAFLDAQGNILQSTIYDNPLKKSYEYADDDGHFQRTEVLLDEEYFSVRIQALPNISQLKLYSIYLGQKVLLLTNTVK